MARCMQSSGRPGNVDLLYADAGDLDVECFKKMITALEINDDRYVLKHFQPEKKKKKNRKIEA